MKKFVLFFCSIFFLLPVFALEVEARTTRTDQTATAYQGSNLTASGRTPEAGFVAVHMINNQANRPRIPFGTTLHVTRIRNDRQNATNFVNIGNHQINAFQVQDVGRGGTGFTTYWLDFWLPANDNPTNFGQGTVSYWHH
jgi:hypothetical protein